MMTSRIRVAFALGLAGLAGGALAPAPAAAQNVDIEVPVLILDTGTEDDDGAGDDDLDLANVVQTAAKGVTTIQEAPAIVTVITSEEIAERGIDRYDDVLDTVPGWLRHDAINNQFPFGLTRGTLQAMLYMQNGVSMFDPVLNVPSVGRMVPVELIKRVEVITGPGGVLWGANSYLGVNNIIFKDAEDVDGIEADVRYGDGAGDENMMRGYVMAGLPEFLHDDVDVMLHASFHTYDGPVLNMPQVLFTTPLPQPNAQVIYGPLTPSNADRSMIFQANANMNLGPVKVVVHAPIIVERHLPLGFPGVVTRRDNPEDNLLDPMSGDPLCTELPLNVDGQRNPDAFTGTDRCVDRSRIARDNRQDFHEKYAMAEYRTRFADGKAGATLKAYVTQFERSWKHLPIFAATSLLEGGLSFRYNLQVYRAGANYDGDLELPKRIRLLYGFEAFREWIPNTQTDSRQGDGTQANAIGPNDLSRLALPCPREPVPGSMDQIRHVTDCPLTFVFESNRAVIGAYVNPQWRYKKLILDGGVRVQAAPDAVSSDGASYDTQLIFSGAAVYGFAKGWHAKLNYAEGFRPPVFNNIASNGESIQLVANQDLDVETSQAVQGEINARLFKGKRRLREVNFRADYSYTTLQNLIQITQGGYQNVGDRGIHSVEFLGKIYLKGGHRVELGYTWLKIATEDKGYLVAQPEHWLNLTGVFNLVEDRLVVATNAKVVGAMEDPNRLVEHRPIQVDPDTGLLPDSQQLFNQPHEVVLDRLPPGAELSLGITWLDAFGVEKLRARAFAYNAFNARRYNPDGFGDYEPRLEFLPNPYPDFRFVTGLTYTY